MHTSGLGQPENRRDEMDNENNQIAHELCYSRTQTTEVGANLEFATDTIFQQPALGLAAGAYAGVR